MYHRVEMNAASSSSDVPPELRRADDPPLWRHFGEMYFDQVLLQPGRAVRQRRGGAEGRPGSGEVVPLGRRAGAFSG